MWLPAKVQLQIIERCANERMHNRAEKRQI